MYVSPTLLDNPLIWALVVTLADHDNPSSANMLQPKSSSWREESALSMLHVCLLLAAYEDTSVGLSCSWRESDGLVACVGGLLCDNWLES